MVSSCHMKVVLVYTFPCNQCHNAFNWERSPVNEISVKKVLVVWPWVLVKFENVQHVIILTVNIATNSDFLLVFNRIVNKWCILLANVFTFLYQLKCISFVKTFLVFVMLHQLHNPKIKHFLTIRKLLILFTRDEVQCIIFQLEFPSNLSRVFES